MPFTYWWSRSKGKRKDHSASSPTLSPYPANPALPTSKVNRVRRYVTDGLMVVIILVLVLLLGIEMSRDIVLIEPFDVPETLAERGYTGRVVARKLIDRLNQIRAEGEVKAVLLDQEPYDFIPAWEQDSSNIQMQGGAFSIRTVARYLKETLGQDILRISGEVTLDEVLPGEETSHSDETLDEGAKKKSMLRVATRVGKRPAEEHKKEFASTGFPTALDKLVCQAAEDIYGDQQPYALAVFLLKRRPERSEELVLSAPQRSLGEQARATLLRGTIKVYQNEPEKALVLYRRAAELDPELWQARFNLALLLTQQGLHAEAEPELQWLERRRTHRSEVDVLHGRWHLTQGHTHEALARFESAASHDVANAQAWYWWGRTLAQQNAHEEALDKLDRAAAASPYFPPILVERKEVLTKLGRTKEAKDLEELLQIKGEEKRRTLVEDCFR